MVGSMSVAGRPDLRFQMLSREDWPEVPDAAWHGLCGPLVSCARGMRPRLAQKNIF